MTAADGETGAGLEVGGRPALPQSGGGVDHRGLRPLAGGARGHDTGMGLRRAAPLSLLERPATARR